jgi:hypothetical protein
VCFLPLSGGLLLCLCLLHLAPASLAGGGGTSIVPFDGRPVVLTSFRMVVGRESWDSRSTRTRSGGQVRRWSASGVLDAGSTGLWLRYRGEGLTSPGAWHGNISTPAVRTGLWLRYRGEGLTSPGASGDRVSGRNFSPRSGGRYNNTQQVLLTGSESTSESDLEISPLHPEVGGTEPGHSPLALDRCSDDHGSGAPSKVGSHDASEGWRSDCDWWASSRPVQSQLRSTGNSSPKR